MFTSAHWRFADPFHNPMMHGSPNQELTFGYLSVIHSSEHGYFGGYLVISVQGRPLEFHCSAPVRPNRAQEILYGPTLQPYLLGEQIGGTLLGRAKLSPRLILTNQPAALCLRGQMDVPIVQLLPHEADLRGADTIGDQPHGTCDANLMKQSAAWDRQFAVHDHAFELSSGFASDRDAAIALLTELAAHVELAEPFDRIYEAIYEAQRIGGRGQDTHGQAA